MFSVSDKEHGERIDRLLTARGLGSRTAVQRWIGDGRVDINGVSITLPKKKVCAGDVIDVRPAAPPKLSAAAQKMDLDIRFEDEHLLIVMKPADLVVHPAPGHPNGTLVNGLVAYLGELPGDDLRPGIVHRLDRFTSGLMVVAKSQEAHAGLIEKFQVHDIQREYTAIAVGAPPMSQTFDTFHGRHPVHRKRFTSKGEEGKRAITHVRLLEKLHGGGLINCRLETGRTHQIRVHAADNKFPLLGDDMYGKTPKDPHLLRAMEAIGRQALHATVLGFTHPVTGVSHHFEDALPPRMQAALDILREALPS